ncbi:fanconi-associated nuclease 1 [Accipiter gentilis]|uniref:fanconi-associated nuclease 1 n=1 Tax=Astur gentilis TaxID=8957 RepID=UPI00210F9EA8|nr:fanconi-associated nuclease 1 [Accipiter gentilis]XP_049669268.1 fanconi-associated nuclease 1 [Accipiter gentilis]XP_049669269.1 fanconi-associated nuclease 1 [Accipiter gentilis]XP_049669270.1 fanconi-associated nuclease 1 [Accipiter gentilis]
MLSSFVMAEARSSEIKRSRISLSLSKNKKKRGSVKKVESKGTPSIPSASSSIVSFFNNVPPAKITCPVCGQMVPRHGINEHMDETCQRKHGEIGVIDSTLDSFRNWSPPAASLNNNSSSYFSKNLLNLETSPPKSSLLKTEGSAAQQISPYFSNNSSVCSVNDEPQAQTVKIVSLGSLASKLSRRRCIQGGKRIVYKEIDSSPPAVHNTCKSAAAWDGDDGIYTGHSSQKENQLAQRELQEQNFSKKELEFQEQVNKCNGEDLVDIVQVSLPADNINGRRLPPGTRSTKTASRSEGVILRPDTFETHLAIYTSAELTNSLEAKTQPHAQVVPSSKTDVNCGTQNCFSKGDVQVLPVEVHEDFKDELNHTLSETVEKVEFQNSIGDILDKINEVSSVPSSPGHPYYLQNFLVVLRAVLENEDDARLFDEQDMNVITKFCNLSVGGQKLYVRLFQRKLNWLKVNKIEYGEISTDLSPIIEELAEARFLQTESELEDLCEGLDLLSAPELKTLAKIFHLPNPNGQKQQLVDDFLRLAKQRSVFSRSQAGIGTVILKRVKDLAGKSVRVCRGPRAVFSRILLLFSLSESMEDEEAGSAGQGQLSTVLMVNMGRMVFPRYTVNRKTQVFQDREDLIRYATAAHLSNDIATAMVNGNWEEANHLYMCAKETWNELKNHPSLSYHRVLPEYLRHFTVGWVYTRILSQGVEILQRLHMYKEAVQELQTLLSQDVYCTDSRGRWWDRLALNLHQHLKNTKKAIDCIRNGLADPFVRTGHRLSLYQRALRIRDSPSCKQFRYLFYDLPVITVEDVTHVTIKGKMCPQTGMGKSVFLMEDIGDEEGGEDFSVSTVMCSVEELALTHYRQNGFDQGIHGEGSTFITLYGILMWDIIFMDDIPDVFRNSYQTSPLDLYTDSFYDNRRDVIEARLQQLHTASSETLANLIADIWTTQEGKAAALVNWGRFISLQQVQSLVSCLGGMFLSGVFRRLSKDLRHCRGGLPDLVVWRTHTNHFKLVEVKGPNDRLSHKQIIWLSELKKLGATVEVCHVQAVGGKSKCLS